MAKADALTLSDLVRQGIFTGTALSLDDPNMPYEDWEEIGRLLGLVRGAVQWAIADWLNYGEAVYGERYAQAVEVTGLEPGTLQTYAYVGRSIARSRRRPELSFSTHRIVAALPPVEQRTWLATASRDGLSSSELRDAMRDKGALPPAAEKPSWSKPSSEVVEDIASIARALIRAVQPGRDGYVRVPADLFARFRAAIEAT